MSINRCRFPVILLAAIAWVGSGPAVGGIAADDVKKDESYAEAEITVKGMT